MVKRRNKLKLQGHEKFVIREGWINKALHLLPLHPNLWTCNEASDLLGIGANMVKSLRYWMKAFGLTNENGSELSKLGLMIATYDPYLEKEMSLWLMHSNIVKNIEFATTWYMYFNRCDADELDKSEIERVLFRETKKYAEGESFSEKSLDNDIDVLLSMYSCNKEQLDPEDKSISPFTKLGLVKRTDGRFAKRHPNKRIIPEEIVLYELFEMMDKKDSISIEELIFGDKGLSKVYNMTPLMANEYLDKLAAKGHITINRTAGLDVLYPNGKVDPIEIIEDFYKK